MKIYVEVPETSINRRTFDAAGIVEDVDPSPELSDSVTRLSDYTVEHLPDGDATVIRDLLPGIVSAAVRCGFAAGLEWAAVEVSNRQLLAKT